MHQDPEFGLEQHYHDLDITRLKREMSGMAQRYMRGDATRMEMYINLGQIEREFRTETGMFYRKWPAHHEVVAMHEAQKQIRSNCCENQNQNHSNEMHGV